MTDERDRFLADRQLGIGGSDVGAILGVNPYKTAHQVWLEKMGEALPEPETPDMTRGREMEPYIARWYERQTGRSVALAPRQYIHPNHPELRVHVDAMAVDPQAGVGPLEFKAPGLRNFAAWKISGLPVYHYVQIQHAIGILPPHLAQYGGACFFSAELWNGVHFDVPPDPEMIGTIQEKMLRFWTDHVLARIPPEMEVEPMEVTVPQLAGSEISLMVTRDDPEWASAVSSFMEARAILEEATAYKTLTEDRIKALVGEDQIVQGGGARVYYKYAKASSSVDWDRLKGARPLDSNKVFARLAQLAEDVPMPALAAVATTIADVCRLDFNDFQKINKAPRPLKVYPLKGDR